MIIKKYVGKTEEEATELAKEELGANVVILNVRKPKRKGLFRIFRRQQYEVTVALEDENEQNATKQAEEQKMRQAVMAVNQVIGEQQNTFRAEQADAMTESDNASKIGEKLDSLQNLITQQMSQGDSETAKEMAKDKEKKADEETSEDEQDEEVVKFIRLLYNTMIDNEVNEKYANQIIEEMEKTHKPGMPFDYALANIYQKMILKFGQTQVITPASVGPRVAFFIGPTGVGKTTTIAKIASLFSINEKKKVALLTADTYRIAAAEQLRTYAGILEIPFRIIYTVDELEQAMGDFRDCDYILIDTAGHSHLNEEQRESMNAFIQCLDERVEKEVFLVLSATTKYRDLTNIADTYSAMTKYKLIFTKLDETVTLGNLLNLRLHTGAPIAYVTNGQNVPEDISQFNPQTTVKQLLGGKK